MPSFVTFHNFRTARTYTYTGLSHNHAMALVDMAAGGHYLVADASPDIGAKVHPRARTSWYTHDLPEEP